MTDWKQRKAPVLRFKGFTDVWEERKLTDVTYSYSGLTYSPTDVQDKGTFVLRSSNVKNDQLIDADNVYVNPDIVNSNNVKVGDVIVVVRNGSRSLIGKHAIVTKEMPHTVIGAFMSAFRGENGDYINALLSTNNFQKEVHKSLGATINQITGKDFSMMNFLTPKLEEQNKIGSFFKQLDNTIALHQRKLKQLQLLQKALIQGLLPYSNKFKPTIKIIKNSSHWYIIPVSNLYKRSNEKNDLSFSIKDIISVAKMHWGQNPKKSDDEYMKTYKVFRKGDIAFEGHRSKKFKYGRFVENNLGNGIVSHVFEVYRPTQTINLSFWKFYIHSEQVMHDILRKSTIKATMMTNLVNNDFLKQSILVPDQKTQQKLGSLFNLVQSELNKQRKKVDELKFIKKFLLQNIFI